MYIDRIILNNFRVYKGKNTLNLSITEEKNVTIITGNNGFGKTTLLTSLVWCLYGKLMADVEERYRKEIYESGGYKVYCSKLMNRAFLDENEIEWQILNEQLKNATPVEKETIQQMIQERFSFSVSLRLKNIFIPALPCNDLEIIRTYNVKTNIETLVIYIDGQSNELTKEVGPEIFINDFIIKKEIAKFFFFDAEKIVELAEIHSIEDRRSLGKAYGEVLGIKKYIDLRNDLENLRLRVSKKNASVADREKLDKLKGQFEQNSKLIDHHNTSVTERQDELLLKRIVSDKLQEKLIREGSSLTIEEMKDFKEMRENLKEENLRLKNRMKEMMELAPLAIVAGRMEEVKNQLGSEQDIKDVKNNEELLKRKSTALKTAISKSLSLNLQKKQQLFDIIGKTLLPGGSSLFKPLLDFSSEQENQFFAVYDNLQNSFSKNFKTLNADLKKQQTSLAMINRKLSDAESKEKDPVIKAIREDKNQIDLEIQKIESECIDIKAKLISITNEQNNFALQISELSKKVRIEDTDKQKDRVAERLIKELDTFIHKLRIKKKNSLEEKILNELNVLMHKRNFIKSVVVVIEGDLIDIELYDNVKRQINKDSLSKGEQQLYATALLKALVDESHIRFPVFIDSPLQKFDKEHAKNIIQDFYPKVSAQVILFPLLEKELNEEEFKLLYPKVSDCYFIKQVGQYESIFEEVNPESLYKTYQNRLEHVHSN
jgi:DNA sulfur modification protein DndD